MSLFDKIKEKVFVFAYVLKLEECSVPGDINSAVFNAIAIFLFYSRQVGYY